MQNLLRFLRKFFTETLNRNTYFIRLKAKSPRLFIFVSKRFSLRDPRGLSFSIGILLSVISLFLFLGTTQDILARDPFVAADVRIMNLVAALRSIGTAKFLLFFTYLGSSPNIISLGVAILVIMLLLGKRRMATFFFVSVASSEILYAVLKQLLHRTRPDIGFSLIPRSGYSFPSGHATVSIVFYGMLGFFLWKISKRSWHKILLIITTIIIIFLIGYSRVYLGVHWVSDVVAGWEVGLSLLLLFSIYFYEREKFYYETNRIATRKSLIAVIGVCLALIEGSFMYFYYINHPLQFSEAKGVPTEAIAPLFNTILKTVQSNTFPKFSETLVGENMEPVSFVMIGTKENLIQAFERAGWSIADEPNATALYQLAIAAILNHSYPTAPVTPSFFNATPHTIAFEKPTDLNTVRERHHTRFWLTNFRYGTIPVWVATASFDRGIRYFITHAIQPDIDTERDFIKDGLSKTGTVKQIQEIQLVPPLHGKNQSADQFFTDGKTYVILLK